MIEKLLEEVNKIAQAPLSQQQEMIDELNKSVPREHKFRLVTVFDK